MLTLAVSMPADSALSEDEAQEMDQFTWNIYRMAEFGSIMIWSDAGFCSLCKKATAYRVFRGILAPTLLKRLIKIKALVEIQAALEKKYLVEIHNDRRLGGELIYSSEEILNDN